MLNIKNVSYSYGKIKAIRNVSVEVKEGKVTALLGPNGAGKSTLVNHQVRSQQVQQDEQISIA